MSTHDDDSPDVHAALLRIADDSFIAPPWREAVARLGPRSTAEEPLAVYQAICDSGWLLADEGFYLVASLVEELTDAEAETSLGEMDARLAAIEKELEGEQDESRPGYELVDEHERLSQQCQDAWDDIFLNKLAAAGEQYIADLYQENRKEFARHYAAGERCFQAAAETYKEVSPDDLVSVASYLNLPSAELARNELEKAGIFSALGNANFVYWNWDCSNASGGIRVNVRRGDARRACSELVAPRARDEESRPSWTCRSCGRRIPGEWAACWQCGASPDATVGGPGTRDTAAVPEVDSNALSTGNMHRIVGAAAIVVLVLLPLMAGHVILALFFAPVAFLMVFLLGRLDASPDQPAGPQAEPENAILLDDSLESQTTICNATVRRAWQAAMIAMLVFPPLGFYSLGLLWKLANRHLPLHAADRWRAGLAFVFSLVAIVFFLFLAFGILVGLPLMILHSLFSSPY